MTFIHNSILFTKSAVVYIAGTANNRDRPVDRKTDFLSITAYGRRFQHSTVVFIASKFYYANRRS